MNDHKTLLPDDLAIMQSDAARLLALLRDEGHTIEPWVQNLLAETIPRAASRVGILREALSFYADMELWQRAWVGGGFAGSPADEDGGDIARRALRGQCDRLWPGDTAVPEDICL